MATATARRSPKLTLEMAHDQLVAGVEAITTSDQWLAYLAVAAKFTRYSANNTFLIMMQRPDATRVAGFHTWKSLGRSVKKGAKGIAILCPCVRRTTVEDADSGETSTHSRVAGFRVGYVFDVADTEGEDLPDDGLNVVHPVGVAPEGMWDTLVQRVEEAGFTVRFGPEHDEALGSAWGCTHFGDRTVTVKSTADPAGACKTLAHELAHVLLHEQSALRAPGHRRSGGRVRRLHRLCRLGARHLELLHRVPDRMERGRRRCRHRHGHQGAGLCPDHSRGRRSRERRWSRHDRAHRLRRTGPPSGRHRVVPPVLWRALRGLLGVLSLSPPLPASRVTAGRRHGR